MSATERPQADVTRTSSDAPDPEAEMHAALDAYSRSVTSQTAAICRSAQATIETARAVKRRTSSGQLAAVKPGR